MFVLETFSQILSTCEAVKKKSNHLIYNCKKQNEAYTNRLGGSIKGSVGV
jgi:hypothetical protein